MARKRVGNNVAVLSAMLLIIWACGGGGEGESTPTDATDGGDATETTAATETEATDAETEPASDEDSQESTPGERSAVITIDGESTKFSLDDVTFSNVEGMDDITFETCDPDFFGSGRFYGIGYAVDDADEVILGEDGSVAGTIVFDLPPDDWEATDRDPPDFEINLGDLDLDIATPEQAASMAPGETMAWSIDDTSASGSAVFVDFENAYAVEFEILCEGEPTVTAALPEDDGSDDGGGGPPPLAGAGVGSFVADGQSFSGVDVYQCEPFSFGSDPHPDDLSLLALVGGSEGIEVEISNGQGIGQGGQTYDQVTLSVFHSRSGDSGLEQFEGAATNDAEGAWYLGDPLFGDATELPGPPFTIDGDRITGELPGLEQTWPDEGAAIVDVTFDLEIPTEVNEAC